MKQKDLALIVAVVIFSAVFSLIVGRLVFTAPKHRQEKVVVIDPITSSLAQPSSQYFNTSSIDPTQLIRIAENTNNTPFNGR